MAIMWIYDILGRILCEIWSDCVKLRIHLSTFFRYKELLAELVKRDIKVRYRRSVLGMLWSVLNPLLTMLVMSFVFSNVFRNNLHNFPVYLLTGQLVFGFFSEATNQCMTSIIDNRPLLLKIYIPKYIFPMSRVGASLVNMMFSLIALIIVMIFTGTPLSWTMLLVPLLFLYTFVFVLGMGLLLSCIAVFFRDIIHLYGVVLTAWMYVTPIFYPVEILPEIGQVLVRFNPLFHYVRFMRQCVWSQEWPVFNMHAFCIAFSLMAISAGLYAFSKNQNKFALNL